MDESGCRLSSGRAGDTTVGPEWCPWTASWLGVCGLAIGNGIARQAYLNRFGDRAAHRISTVTLLALIAGWTVGAERRWPLPNSTTAAAVGATWTGLTIAFEFGFGHYVARQSWRQLTAAYDMPAGELWPLIPLSTLTAPELARRLRQRRLI